jgi:tetratricopeptide (TPR) repeat protein
MDLADQVQESTRRGSDDRGLAMSILLRSQCLLRLNQTDEAVNNLEQLTGLNPKVLEEASSLSSVIRAVAQFKKGNLDAAEAFGKQALTQLSKLTLNYESIIEYSVLAEFLIGLASSQMGSPQPSRRKDAAMACRLLTKHSNFFPGGKAQALQLRGLCLVHSGNPKAAMRAWKSSIAHARKYSMPYDEARTLYQMGLHAPQSTEERIQHLRRAVELLEQCGASVDLAEARQALSACTGMQSGTGDGHNA